MKQIYLDHAATTYVKPEVLDAMLPYFTQQFGNPSSVHSFGRDAKAAIEAAREQVAKALGAKPEEILFTGGGSESDNMAIRGIAEARKSKGNHIITTSIEHHAVLHTCQYLEKQGFEVTYLPVDSDGLITAEQVEAAITDQTILITIMFANNEIGTIMPIAEIGQIAKKHKIAFHTDAVQAVGAVEIDVNTLGVDLLSLSAHKFYGPKGVGALYIRKGTKVPPLIHGGAQERNRRAGTENLPAIVGLGKAIELATANIPENSARLAKLRDKLIHDLLEQIPETRLNGHPTKRLPNNANLSFRYVEGEGILLSLDIAGIAASSGSACTSGSLDPSHVLLGIGLTHEIAHGSVRYTLGDGTSEEEIDYTVEATKKAIERLRAMSPLFAQEQGGVKHV